MRRVEALIAPLLALICFALPSCASPTSSAAIFPTVGGAVGKTPTIIFPTVAAPATLESEGLVKGTGPPVEKGQLLVASYVGQIWRGKVFDSSFSRHQLAAFPIGLGHVIPGWDKTLVGVRAGSRMLLVIPPVDGYGAAGDAKVGITGTDTLVFVVDVVASYSKTVTGDLNAAVLTSDVGEIAVTGALGQPPNIHIAGTALPPAKSIATVIAKGIGPPVKPGLVVLQYVVVDWTTNSIVQSTWKNGLPDGEVVGEAATPNVLDTLVGIPIGSRVLVQIPKVSSGGPYALAVDIVAEPTSA